MIIILSILTNYLISWLYRFDKVLDNNIRRWQCQCSYFEMGKLTQSYWDQKLWNYLAFIVSALTFFLNSGSRGGGSWREPKKKLKKIKRWVGELNNLGEDAEFFSGELGERSFNFTANFPKRYEFNQKVFSYIVQ